MKVVSTDPPYYDNIGYADLSDFFYVWLRRSLKPIFPDIFATLAVPKAEELIATPYRHESKEQAEAFFLDGMTSAMHNLAEQSHPAFPVTIYYAFKQSETKGDAGTHSTGWETFLEAVLRAGFILTGTWPMRSEQTERLIGKGANALASSIILVCRKRTGDAITVSRREFLRELNAALPQALLDMTRGGVNSPAVSYTHLIEHVENKSQNPQRTFEYNNLAASALDSENDLHALRNQGHEVFGGHASGKQQSVDMARFVSCHQLDCRRFFSYLSDGRIVPANNLFAHEFDKADYTITLLNLNSPYLVNLRKKWWDELDQLFQEHTTKGWSLHDLSSVDLVPRNFHLSRFFSLTRQFFGNIAEQTLQQQAPALV